MFEQAAQESHRTSASESFDERHLLKGHSLICREFLIPVTCEVSLDDHLSIEPHGAQSLNRRLLVFRNLDVLLSTSSTFSSLAAELTHQVAEVVIIPSITALSPFLQELYKFLLVAVNNLQ